MFCKVAFVVSAFILSVAATDSKCNTGPIQCCNSVQSANSPEVLTALGLAGAFVKDATTMVGLTCSPINALDMSGNSCSSQPVCCENNSFDGAVAIGCSPMNVNV